MKMKVKMKVEVEVDLVLEDEIIKVCRNRKSHKKKIMMILSVEVVVKSRSIIDSNNVDYKNNYVAEDEQDESIY